MKDDKITLLNYNLNKLRSHLIVASYTTVTPHWQDSITHTTINKLYLIESGEGCITIDNVDYFPKAGDFMFIPDHCDYSYSTKPENCYTKYWCHFDSNIATLPLHTYFDFPYLIPASHYSAATALFKQLIHYDNPTLPFAPLQANGLLLQLLFMFFSDCAEHLTIKSKHTHVILEVVNYIESNLHRKMTIAELAGHVHLNPSYLCSLFSASIGSSPIDYINRRRIDLAKSMLLECPLTIEKIAYSLGFNSPYYFSNTFKKYTGLSPSQYRTTAS